MEFNVLQPELNVHKNYLLEASAGTGKTFSIENIIVRLLIEDNPAKGSPLDIDEILTVTFTRAAASDLKSRIRSNIEKAIAQLQNSFASPTLPYLQPHIDQGDEAVAMAKKRLEQALFRFDQAKIFTIHGFCAKMLAEHPLEGNITIGSNADKESIPATEVLRVIRNFFRTGLSPSKYCAAQIEQLLTSFRGVKGLEDKLAVTIKKRMPIKVGPDFTEIYERYCQAIATLKSSLDLQSDRIIEDFNNQIGSYKKYESKYDINAHIQKFALQFDKAKPSPCDFEALIREELLFVEALAPENLNKRSKPFTGTIHYPDLHRQFKEKLLPIVEEAESKDGIFARMAKDCQLLLRRYCEQEEKTSYDDLLENMRQALKNHEFMHNVRSKFRAAIIDEFQDTDPTQWEIFRALFQTDAEHPCYLYIVGDPKQSIYAFRQADIYTYLSAGESLGKDNHATLNTNFRSEEKLIDALNILFSDAHCPDLIQLPRKGSSLPYLPVHPGRLTAPMPFDDGLGNVHFYIADRDDSADSNDPDEILFFPYITQEIQRLHQRLGLPYKSFAVLVSTHNQAELLGQFLAKYNIPYSKQRCDFISESSAYTAMRELLEATINPKDESALRCALSGDILQYDHEELLGLNDLAVKAKCVANFAALHEELVQRGFSAFYETLLTSRWHRTSNQNVRQKLLANSSQTEFYQDLQQIAELLMEYQCSHHPNPDGLLSFLGEFPNMQINDDEKLKRRSDPQRDAVTIITIHSSKGLEYDIVFALGLKNTTGNKEELIPIHENGLWMLTPKETADESASTGYLLEKDAEKMRQLYVAMTRAKHRLYLPVVPQGKKMPNLGEASPMMLYLARLAQPPAAAEELYERIRNYDLSQLTAFIDRNSSHSISYTLLDGINFTLEKEQEAAPPQLQPPKQLVIPGTDLYMQSFSSLSIETAAQENFEELGEAPHDFTHPEKTAHTLPAGSETGNLLHLLLENLEFDKNNINELVTRHTKNSKYGEWGACLASILQQAMHCPLDDFTLHEVKAAHCYKEMEFVYPVDAEMPWMEEVSYQSGYLKGIIDLIFRHNGQYYLLDWKSNWLGQTAQDYTPAKMHEAMLKHHYYLQAALYKKALERYLALVDPRPFESIFGGTFYVFLRGLSSDRLAGNGIIKILPHQGIAEL